MMMDDDDYDYHGDDGSPEKSVMAFGSPPKL